MVIQLYHRGSDSTPYLPHIKNKDHISKVALTTYRNLHEMHVGKWVGWGDSSVGRVLALQVQSPGFDPKNQKKQEKKKKERKVGLGLRASHSSINT